MIFQYIPVERIHYGINVVKDGLVKEIQKFNRNRALIVTTNSMLETVPFKKMLESLKSNHIETFVKCSKQHVPSDMLMQGVQDIFRFQPDLIISCGGGSPIDEAKIIAMILSEGIKTGEDLYLYSENMKEKAIQMKNAIPHIAIPTTLSASEFTSIAGVTNGKNHIKYKFSHLNMTPSFVFLDPVFTENTPSWLWVSTGIRAVDHAVETLYSPKPNPINTGLALQAIKKLYVYLPLSKKDPANLEYRLECQIGAWLSLFSVVNIKLGLSHSIGHQLGALFNIPHGMTSAIMLPHVMKYLLPRTYEEQAQIPIVLGKAELGQNSREISQKAPHLIRGLIEELELPHRIRDFNVSKDQIPTLIHNILIDIQSENNAFVLNSNNLREEITNLIEEAW